MPKSHTRSATVMAGITPSQLFAEQLKATRERKGWTQHQLARRLTELGCPMERSVIAKIERHARNVSIDEAFALGAALDVSPASLLLPRDQMTKVAVTPTISTTAFRTREWLRELMPLDFGEQRFFDDARPDAEALAFARWPLVRQIAEDAASVVFSAGFPTEPPDKSPPLMKARLINLASSVTELIRRLEPERSHTFREMAKYARFNLDDEAAPTSETEN